MTKNETLDDDITTRIATEKLGLGVAPEPKKKRHYNKKVPHQLRGHEWKPGQSGNPKGRPINPLSLTALLNKKLSEHPEDAEAIVNALIALGKRSNINQLGAIDKIFDRIDGKVIETHKIEGEFPIKILFVPAQELIEGKVEEIEPAPEPLRLKEHA